MLYYLLIMIAEPGATPMAMSMGVNPLQNEGGVKLYTLHIVFSETL